MRRTRTLPRRTAARVIGALVLAAVPLAVGPPAPAAAAPPVTSSASSTSGTLDGDLVARHWHIDPGSGTLGALDAGATTTALTDVATGGQHVSTPSPDFSLTANGVTLTSATGWTSVTAVAGTAAADSGHGAGPLGQPPAMLTFTYTRTTGPVSLILTRSYRLAGGDAMTEARTSLRTVGAPVAVTGWTVDEVTTPAAATAQVVELHSGSSYTSRHRVTHDETGAFDDQGEVAVQDDGPGSGLLLVDQRRAGPSTRMLRTVSAGSSRLAAAVEPGRELGIVPVESVTGSDTDNSLANSAYPAGGRVETLAPGATLDLGTAYLGVFAGGDDAAPAVLQRHLAGSVLVAGPADVQQNTFHPFNDGNGMTATTMLAQARADATLGVGTLILDDGWQGGPHGLAGDWRLDPAKFPDADGDGRADLPGQVRATGLRFGLWVEALLFNPHSDAYTAHPDWACAPAGDASAQVPDSNGLGYWDATNTAWQSYMTGVIDRLVADGATVFKLDNEQWMDCGTHTYTEYERAWETLVAAWQARHPQVLFQLDETVDERSYPYAGLALGPTWFEDDHVKGTSHPGATKLSQELSDLWQTTPWVPPSTMGIPLFHDTLSSTAADGAAAYQLPFALLGQATLWRDTTSLSPADAAETRWWTAWYAGHPAYSGLVLNDSTDDPIDGLAPMVLQPWDHATRSGYLTVVRQGGGNPGPQMLTVRARDVDIARTYTLTDVRTGEVLGSFAGTALAAGIPVTMADRFRTRVLEVAPTAPAPDLPEAPLALALPLAALLLSLLLLLLRRRAKS